MKFIINGFDKLDLQSQKDVQDFVAGITSNFVIEEDKEKSLSEFVDSGCDVCGLTKHLFRVDEGCGIIHLCKDCIYKKGDKK